MSISPVTANPFASAAAASAYGRPRFEGQTTTPAQARPIARVSFGAGKPNPQDDFVPTSAFSHDGSPGRPLAGGFIPTAGQGPAGKRLQVFG